VRLRDFLLRDWLMSWFSATHWSNI
jgi:hypothetical protein